MTAGETSSEEIVAAYLQRIAEIDDAGPTPNAVTATFPDAMPVARERDAERKAGRLRGPLHGIPVLLKHNIKAAGPVPTTAGPLPLTDTSKQRNAPPPARARDAAARKRT